MKDLFFDYEGEEHQIVSDPLPITTAGLEILFCIRNVNSGDIRAVRM